MKTLRQNLKITAEPLRKCLFKKEIESQTSKGWGGQHALTQLSWSYRDPHTPANQQLVGSTAHLLLMSHL